MTTPTAPIVLASEGMPAQYRPGNQANLEPAEAMNFCPSQGMLPGLGQVRSGSPVSNGLSPDTDHEVEAYLALAGRVRSKGNRLNGQLTALMAKKQMADQTNDGPTAKKVRRDIQHVVTQIGITKKQEAQALRAAKAADVPIWRKQVVAVGTTAEPVPMQQVSRMGYRQYAPAGVGNFFTQTSIPFVPNWALLASAGVLSLVLIMKKR